MKNKIFGLTWQLVSIFLTVCKTIVSDMSFLQKLLPWAIIPATLKLCYFYLDFFLIQLNQVKLLKNKLL